MSKAHDAVMAYPLLNAHFLSSFLHAEYISGRFIIKTVDVEGPGADEEELLRRHENVFCDGDEGADEGEVVVYKGNPVAESSHCGSSVSFSGMV